MMRLLASTSLVAVLLATPLAGSAWAQSRSGAPAPANPALAAPESADAQQLNVSDRIFMQAAAWGGMAEVEFGRMAQQKAHSERVKAFGRRMVEDHGKANDRLKELAKAHGFDLPKALDAEHESVRDRLEKASGAAFDRAYMLSQIQDHQKTAQLLEYEIGSGQNADLKSFASETLPTIFEHLRMAQDIDAMLAVETAQAAEKPGTAPAARSAPAQRDGAGGEKAGARELNRQQLQQQK